MKLLSTLVLTAVVAVMFYFVGASQGQTIEEAAADLPRGGLNIPAQWFMMESLVGWEKMMLIFGYADNEDVCMHMLEIAQEESPDRRFRCMAAN
ncbi:MAG: hypothetical protein AB7U75_17315 [Hyphomicrobiaceae bacterium]